jgi:hypothetical protein
MITRSTDSSVTTIATVKPVVDDETSQTGAVRRSRRAALRVGAY